MPLIGGSSGGEANQGFTHGFFQEGITSTQFKSAKTYTGRILPAFDMSIADKQSDEFKRSFVPYRNSSGPQDFLTSTEGYSSWYYQICGYTFLGNGKRSLISNLSTVSDVRNARGVCPVADCQRLAYSDKVNGWKPMTVKIEGEMNTLLPRARYFALMNVLLLAEGTQEVENHMGILTSAGMDNLRQSLARRAGRGDEVISPDWEDYLFGDVTHPEQGLTFTIRETVGSNAQIKFAGMHFSRFEDRLEGHQQFPIDMNSQTGLAQMTSRYNISDDTNVTKIPDYEEVLDWMVSDGFLPYDLICQACSPHVNRVPPKPATYSTPAGSTTKVQPDSNASALPPTTEAAAAPQAPAAPKAPAAAPTVASPTPESRFWYSDATGTHGPETVSSLQTMFADGSLEKDVPLMAEDQSGGWITAAGAGITFLSTPEAPPAPQAAVKAPAPPAPPAVPAPTDVVSADEEAQYQELHARFTESANNLSAQELPVYFRLLAQKGALQQA